MQPSFIYVIGPTVGPVKIGYAVDVAGRLSQLQVGCPDDLVVHKAVSVSGRLAGMVEAHLHEHFADRHRRGEWFNVDAEEAGSAAISMCAAAEEKLQNAIERADIDKDVFARAAHRTWVEPIAREAVAFYLGELRVNRDSKAVKTMNGYIRQKAGAAPLVLFCKVFVDGVQIEYEVRNRTSEVNRGYLVLARALNALAQYYEYRKKVVSGRIAAERGDIRTLGPADYQLADAKARKLRAQTAAIAKRPAA